MPEPAYFVCLNCGSVLIAEKADFPLRIMTLLEQLCLPRDWAHSVHEIWRRWHIAKNLHIDNHYDKLEKDRKC